MSLKLDNPYDFELWLKENSEEVCCSEKQWMVGVDDVRALYEALRPRWVPVEQSEPEKDGCYEVTHGISGLHCTVREVCHAFFRSKTNGLYRWTDAIGRPVLYVVAWKPVTPEYWDDVPPLPEES